MVKGLKVSRKRAVNKVKEVKGVRVGIRVRVGWVRGAKGEM